MSDQQPEQQPTQASAPQPDLRRQLVTKAAVAAVGGVVSAIAKAAAMVVWHDTFGDE
ncbi:hypothetical protein [Streptomyces sp. NPDC002078]